MGQNRVLHLAFHKARATHGGGHKKFDCTHSMLPGEQRAVRSLKNLLRAGEAQSEVPTDLPELALSHQACKEAEVSQTPLNVSEELRTELGAAGRLLPWIKGKRAGGELWLGPSGTRVSLAW